jgi:magnesium-transporting ATPase (P-type)
VHDASAATSLIVRSYARPQAWRRTRCHQAQHAGTLTENRMTVVEGWFAGVKHDNPPCKSDLSDVVANEVIKNICLNSKAFYTEEEGKKTQFVGNRTECALLQLSQKDFGVPYDGVRKQYEDRVVQVRFTYLCFGSN